MPSQFAGAVHISTDSRMFDSMSGLSIHEQLSPARESFCKVSCFPFLGWQSSAQPGQLFITSLLALLLNGLAVKSGTQADPFRLYTRCEGNQAAVGDLIPWPDGSPLKICMKKCDHKFLNLSKLSTCTRPPYQP